MASELLKTLKKVEDSRKNMIENIRNGLKKDISDNASFSEISKFIGTYTQDFSNLYPEKVELWSRPKEWPDCHSIIRSAELVEGYTPLYIALLNTDSDTTFFPAPSGNWYGNDTKEPVKWGTNVLRLVLSDGTIYNNVTADITHTWDKTKDIVVTEGKYKGNYRWFMVYEKGAGFKYHTLAGLPVAEILIYGTKIPNNPTTNNWVSGYSTDTINETLVNFEVLPEYPNTSVGFGSYGMYQRIFNGNKKLENLDIGNVTTFSPSSTNGYTFSNLNSLRRFYGPKCTSTNPVTGALNSMAIQEVVANVSSNFTIYVRPQLVKLSIPNSAINFGTTSGVPGYLREDCELNVQGFQYNPPIYWTDNKNYMTGIGDTSYVAKYHYNLRRLDLSPNIHTKGLITTDDSIYMSITKCHNLREVIVSSNWKHRMDLSDCSLNPSNVLELLDKLQDLTNITQEYYEPIIKLSEYNKGLLTDNDIKIATDKGWVIE